MTLHLVRHGPSLVDRAVPAHEWELDPQRYDAVWALREQRRLPLDVPWYSSPEPKAIQTAQLLTDAEVPVVEGLREHRRESTRWYADFPAVVRRALAQPHRSAAPGWEPVELLRERVTTAVAGLRDAHPGAPLVLVGHGTAWTVLVAALTGRAPDVEAWERLAMPDVWTVEPDEA